MKIYAVTSEKTDNVYYTHKEHMGAEDVAHHVADFAHFRGDVKVYECTERLTLSYNGALAMESSGEEKGGWLISCGDSLHLTWSDCDKVEALREFMLEVDDDGDVDFAVDIFKLAGNYNNTK